MRKLDLNIKTCSECPYLWYDETYGMTTDSGYECRLIQRQIYADNFISSNNLDEDKLPIHEWCKLPKIDEVLYYRRKKINKIKKRLDDERKSKH